MKHNVTRAAKTGFSLVEMLVVIAVIGIIAAIAVPNISRINDSAKDATLRRNAQNIASVFAAGEAAGVDFSAGNRGAVIRKVITGDTVNDSSSPFDGSFFGVPGLEGDDEVNATTGAAKYLTWDNANKQLLYTGGK